MLIIHPGFIKTGTTYLQNLVQNEEWFVGFEKQDSLSRRLSWAVRHASGIPHPERGSSLSDLVAEMVQLRPLGAPTFFSEEAILAPRPYEVSFKIGLYKSIGRYRSALDDLVLKGGSLDEPATKLAQVARSVQGVERTWLLTIRRHDAWCRSYYRYSLSELGPERGALFLQALAAMRSLCGPLFFPTLELLRTLDPEAPIVVLPMEVMVDPQYQTSASEFFEREFGLQIPFSKADRVVNASNDPIPSSYTKFVRSMTFKPIPLPLRRVGRSMESAIRRDILPIFAKSGKINALEAGFPRLHEAFKEDVTLLQPYCPFDLEALGYAR